MIETSLGIEVADTAHLGEEARKDRVRYSELPSTVELLNVKQRGSGPLKMILDRKISAVEKELVD